MVDLRFPNDVLREAVLSQCCSLLETWSFCSGACAVCDI